MLTELHIVHPLVLLVLKATILLVAASTAALLLRRQSAALRHLVWTCCAAGLLLLPLLTLALPSWRLPVEAGSPRAADQEAASRLLAAAPPADSHVPPAAERPLQRETAGTYPAAEPVPTEEVTPASVAGSEPAPPPEVTTAPEVIPADGGNSPGESFRGILPVALGLVWLAGTLLFLAVRLAGERQIRKLLCRCRRIDPGEPAGRLFSEASGVLRLKKPPIVLASESGSLAFACGSFRPFVVLPESTLGWPREKLLPILLHELAHVKRRDCLSQCGAQCARALFWFHPLAWWMTHQMHLEREKACDDTVVQAGHEPSRYGKVLLALATEAEPGGNLPHCAIAVARKSALEGRLLALLDPRRNRRGISRSLLAGAVAVASVIAIPLAMLQTVAVTGAETKQDAEAPAAAGSFPGLESIYAPLDEESGAAWLAHWRGDSDEKNVLSGRVLDLDGNPLSEVRVLLGNDGVMPSEVSSSHDPSAGFSVSDDDGRFQFDSLWPGRTSVWAIAEGPDGAWWAGWVRHLATDASDVNLILEPIGSELLLGGRVVDAGGNPVPGTRLYLRNNSGEPKGSVSQTISDENGLFRFQMPMPSLSLIRNQSLYLFGQSPEGDLAWKLIPPVDATDVTLVMQPTVHLHGQVVGPEGENVSGASVHLHSGTNAHAGSITLSTMLREQTSETVTDGEGSFSFPGVPKYSRVSLRVTHPRYGEGRESVYVNGTDTTLKRPILIDPPIVIEGVVLRKHDRVPLPGAQVTSHSGVSTESDIEGHFSFDGLTIRDVRRYHVHIVAEWEEDGERLSGQRLIRRSLKQGDRVRGVEIELDVPPEIYRDAYMARRGEYRPSRYNVAVLHDADPEYRGQSEYEDTLTLFNDRGEALWDYVGFNVTESAHAERGLTGNPDGTGFWVNDLRKSLVRLDGQGNPDRTIDDVRGIGMEVDPVTGNLWLLTTSGTIYGEELLVFEADGQQVARHDVAGGSLRFSPFDDSVWVAARELIRMTREGEVLFQSDSFPWTAVALDVDPRTGWAWVVEGAHPDVVTSENRLHAFTPDGQRRITVSLGDGHARGGVAADPHVEIVWTLGDQLRQWDAYDGALLKEIPIGGWSLAIEPDTGYLWVGSHEEIMRLDRDGRPVWVHSTEDGGRKWLELVEALEPAAPVDESLAARDRLLRQREQEEIERRRAERAAVRTTGAEPDSGDPTASDISVESLNYQEIVSAHRARYREPAPPREPGPPPEFTFLPVGSEAPDIEIVRIADGETVRLSDFHGKVVLVEFWAAWCGPCQGPMDKLQEMVAAHPEWEDRVAVIALSIDAEMATAADHLETNGWHHTRNMWVGPGAWDAEPTRLFNLEAIPSFYLVDQGGNIHLAGNPHYTDVAASISDLLD